MERVELESPRLMEKFVITTTNQIEARMCFGTDIMSNLLDLTEKFGDYFDISFIEGKVYIVIHTTQNNFEPNILKTVKNPELYKKIYEEISVLLEVINKFKLHQNKILK